MCCYTAFSPITVTSYTRLRVNQISSCSLNTDRWKNYKQSVHLYWVWLPKACWRGFVPPILFLACFPLFFPIFEVLFSNLALYSRDLNLGGRSCCCTALSFSFVLKCADLNVYLVDGSSERGDKDASKITTYPPGAVRFDCELRAVQVSCGFHHSGIFICTYFATLFEKQNTVMWYNSRDYVTLQWYWWKMETFTHLVTASTGNLDMEMSTPGMAHCCPTCFDACLCDRSYTIYNITVHVKI